MQQPQKVRLESNSARTRHDKTEKKKTKITVLRIHTHLTLGLEVAEALVDRLDARAHLLQ